MPDQYPVAISHLDKNIRRRLNEALADILGGQDWMIITREPGLNSKAWTAWKMPIPAELADHDPAGLKDQRLLQTLAFAQAAIARTGAVPFEER